MNYEAARINMVDCQIHPMGVASEDVLSAYQNVPREMFVPEGKQGFAYVDEDIELSDGRYLMEASTHARLIEALHLSSDKAVLDIGDPSGYSAAILSSIASTVITLDQQQDYPTLAEQRWGALGADNVVAFEGTMQDGLEQHAPYDAILMNGAVGFVPQKILNQLSDGGRLVAVLRSDSFGTGKAMLYIRTDNVFSERCLFDSAIPYLPGFEPKTNFKL